MNAFTYFHFQGEVVSMMYPNWVMGIALSMIGIGVLPIPLVFLLRRYQCLKFDVNIHEGSIRRIDTTVSTKEMITDVDVSDNQRLGCHFNKHFGYDTIFKCFSFSTIELIRG